MGLIVVQPLFTGGADVVAAIAYLLVATFGLVSGLGARDRSAIGLVGGTLCALLLVIAVAVFFILSSLFRELN